MYVILIEWVRSKNVKIRNFVWQSWLINVKDDPQGVSGKGVSGFFTGISGLKFNPFKGCAYVACNGEILAGYAPIFTSRFNQNAFQVARSAMQIDQLAYRKKE